MRARSSDLGPDITERGGDLAARHQLQRLIARYAWAASHAGGTVVEVACGTGAGLGLLRAKASHLIGGDLSEDNLAIARDTYSGRVPLMRLDAHALPFRSGSVNTLLLLEALYFLRSAESFLREAKRVLATDGVLLTSVVNADCVGFDAHNPHYARTFGAPDLRRFLESAGFEVQLFGTTPMDGPDLRSYLMRPLKRIAVELGLIPRSMASPWKRFLRRAAFGPLVPIPAELSPQHVVGPAPTVLRDMGPDHRYQAILALAISRP